MARDVPEPEFLNAAQKILVDVRSATETIKVAGRDLQRRSGVLPGGRAAPGDLTRTAREVEQSTKRGLAEELKRLEVLKAETQEIKVQGEYLARRALARPAGYVGGRPLARDQVAADEQAAIARRSLAGQRARERAFAAPEIPGPFFGSQLATGRAPYGPRTAGPQVALEAEIASMKAAFAAEIESSAGVTAAHRRLIRDIDFNRVATRNEATSSRRVREANIAEAQQSDALIAARARQIANLSKLGPGVRQEALGYLFPGTQNRPSAAQLAAQRTAAGPLGGAVSFSQPRGATPVALFESNVLSKQYPGNIRRATEDIQRLGLVQAEASQQMRRHGALTTEFLQALARGETTLSEFRFQIGSTIAKFGGWTLAAASVFVALDAVQKLGAGAKESANGVATLQRFFDKPGAFNADQAREGFRNVSKDLNVPIKEVVDTQSQFARVFHNQADSLTATRTAILATKLDNIALGDSYRFLTAIVQEGQVPISRVPVLFDQISAAQRRLGARAGETLPAIARSLAAVQNAAGSTGKNKVLNQLLAIAATTQVATGQTGSSVGTALYRGASTFFPRPDNQAILKGFGIDTSKGFTDSIIQAVRKAQGLPGEQRRQISQAFLGPQLGGRFASLFNRKDQLNQALTDTSPLKSQGSAAQELADQLQRVDEQLAKVGTTLGNIGADLGRSGAFAPLGLILHTVNGLTGGVEGLLHAFNSVPAPVRKILVGLLEVYGVMKLLRTGFGTAAADALHVPFLGASQDARDRRQTVIGLRGTETTQANLYEQTANQAALQKQQSIIARQAGREAAIEAEKLDAAGLTASTQGRHAELLRQQSALDDEANVLERQSLAAEQQTAILQEQVNATRARITALQKGGNLTLEEQAAANAFNARAAGGGAASAAAGTQAAGAQAAGAASQEVADASAVAAGSSEALATKMTVAGTEMEASAAAQRAAAAEIVGVSGLLGKLSIGGVLGGAFLAFTGFEVIKGAIDEHARKIEAEAAKLKTPSSSPAQLRANTRKVLDSSKKNVEYLAANAEQLQRDANALAERHGRPRVDVEQTVLTAHSGPGGLNARSALQNAKEAVNNQIQDLTKATGGSDNLYGRSYQELNTALIKAAARFQGHPRQFEAYYTRVIAAAHHSIDVLTGSGKGLQAALDHAANIAAQYFVGTGPTKADPFAQFRKGTLEQNTANIDLVSQREQIGQRQRSPIQTLAKGFVFDTSRYGRSNNAEVLKKLGDEQQQITDYVQNQVSQITQGVENLPLNRQHAVYERALAVIRRADRALGTSFKQRKDQLAEMKGKLRDLVSSQVASGGDELRGGQRLTHTPFDAQIAVLRVQIKQFETNLAITKTAVRLAQRALRNLIREQQKAEADARKEIEAAATADARTLLEAQNRYATSQVGSKGQGASNIAGLRRILSFDRAHGADKSSILDDLSAINEANAQIRESAAQAAEDAKQKAEELYRAKIGARIAGTDDPIKKARIQLEADVHLLRQANRGTADYYNQLAAVRNDRRDLTQSITQEDISQADFEHTIGKLTDEQYVKALRNILKTKHLGRDLRRQLRTQIYQLTHEDAQDGSLDLNVGNIRLPTLYDVRRLAKQGTNTAPVTVQQTNHYTIPVRNDADAEKVGTVLTDIHGANVTGAMRAAGIA